MQDFSTLPAATVRRQTAVSAAALWQVLSDLGDLAAWAPGIDGAEVLSATTQGLGVQRVVTTAQFGQITQDVTLWDDQKRFGYVTAESGPFARTLTVYELSESADGGAEVSVALSFEVKPGTMPVEQAIAVLEKGLAATLQALELRARMIAK